MNSHARSVLACAVLAAALSIAMPNQSIAAVPSVMNFQAILLDDQGQIVPDSAYEIEFGMYPASTGIPAIWQEVQIVTTSGGLFNAMLGTVTPLASEIFIGESWLQMRLTSSPEPFLPRTRIGATPYAYKVESIDQSKGGQVSGKLTVDSLAVGQLGVPGRISVVQGNSAEGASIQPYGSLGAALRINDEAGNPCVQLRPDNSGEGGWLYVHRNDVGSAGFTVEGNTDATLEPSVRISGSTQSIEFDLTQTGSATVALTPDAIDAGETLDEPGVASNMESSQLTIGNSRTNLLSRAIVAPADGFVFITATVELSVSYDTGRVYIGLTNDPVDAYDTLSFLVTIDSSDMDDCTRVVQISAVLPVDAGVDTYYLFGINHYHSSTFVRVTRRTLSVLYFPTQYGTVVLPSAESGSQNASTDAGQNEARTAEVVNAARIERELAAMKARLLELESAMTEQESDNPQR